MNTELFTYTQREVFMTYHFIIYMVIYIDLFFFSEHFPWDYIALCNAAYILL